MEKYGYMHLINYKNRVINGSVKITGRENNIEILGYSHQIYTATDSATGKLVGYPTHSQVKIKKEFDKSSISLLKCLTEQEIIKSGIIRWYATQTNGVAVESHSVSFKNLKVVGFARLSNHYNADDNIYEEVSFIYEGFTWTNSKDNVAYSIALNTPPELLVKSQHHSIQPQYSNILVNKKTLKTNSLRNKPYDGNIDDFYYHSTRITNLPSIKDNGLMPTTLETAVGGTTLADAFLHSSLKVIANKFFSFLSSKKIIDTKSSYIIKAGCNDAYLYERDKLFSSIVSRYKEITSFDNFDQFFMAKANKSEYSFPKDYPLITQINFDWEEISPTAFFNHFTKNEKIKLTAASKKQLEFLTSEIKNNYIVHDIIVSYSLLKGLCETEANNIGTLCMAGDPKILGAYINKPLSEGIASCIFRIPKEIIDDPENGYQVKPDMSQHQAIRIMKAIPFDLLEYIEIKAENPSVGYMEQLRENSNFHH